MNDWSQFVSSIGEHLRELEDAGCDLPFFRGHTDKQWSLLCGLGRQDLKLFKKQNLESILYYDFMSQAGPLLGKSANSWDVLFAMQHHGLPTRLLDWTTAFAPALYFSIIPYLHLKGLRPVPPLQSQPCVWILNPFELNRLASLDAVIANPYTDFDGTYQENFIDESKEITAKVIAINPTQHAPRQIAQRSVFTLHKDLSAPMEKDLAGVVKRFDLPNDALVDAIEFLTLAGTNEYSLFPDLDGLARHLNREHVLWRF